MKASRLSRGLKLLTAFAAVLLVVCLALAFAAVKVLQNDDYEALAIWAVEHVGACRMVVEGDFNVHWSRELTFSASDIRFEPLPDGDAPNLSAIGRLRVQIDLPSLLRRIFRVKHLEVARLRYTRRPEKESRKDPRQTPGWPWGFIIPLVEHAALDDLRFFFSDPNAKQPHELVLHHLSLDDIDDQGPLRLQGHGRLNAEAFRIDGRTGGTLAFFQGQNPFPIDLAFQIADLQASLRGAIDHPTEGRGFQLKITIEEQDLANLFKVFMVDVPSLGRLSGTAELTGDIASLRLTGLNLAVENAAGIQMSAKGSVPDLATGRGTEVAIEQEIKNRGLLDWLFPDDWKVVEEFHLKAALHNVDGRYVIDIGDARVANDKGLVFQSDGTLQLGNPFEASLLSMLDLNLRIASPDTAALKPLLTDAIPEIGGVQGRARLMGSLDRLAMEDMYIDRGGSGPVEVVTRGRIGRIPLVADDPLEDMDIHISIQAEDSKLLRSFYGIPLGELGTVDLAGRVVGSSRRFKLQEVALQTETAEGLKTRVTGGIDFKRRKKGGVTGDINFKLQFDTPTIAIGEPLLGVGILSPLGPVHGSADVTGTTEALTFENILVAGGDPDQLYAEWYGRVKSVPLGKRSVSSGHETFGRVYAARSSDFGALFDLDLPDLGPVQGSWRDTDSNGILGMADIEVAVGDGKRFDLQVNGKIDNLIDQNEYATFEEEQIVYRDIAFQFQLKAADSHGLAQIVGTTLPNLGAVRGQWSITGGEGGLAVQNIDLRTHSENGFKSHTVGSIGLIEPRAGGKVEAIDVRLSAQAPALDALPGLADVGFPALGSFEARGRLQDENGAMNLEKLAVRAGPKNEPTLTIQGRLGNLNDPQRIQLDADFETGARPWLEKALDRKITADPRLEGSLAMGKAGDQIRIDRFRVTAQERGGLAAEGAGTLTMGGDSREVDLQLNASAPDPPAWGRLIDVDLPSLAPTQITGWYREKDNLHEFNGDVRLGESRFQADFHGTTGEPKPVIEATLAAQSLRLQDLGFYPPNTESESLPDSATQDQGPKRLFTEDPLPLERLDAFDLSLKIMADQVISRETVFKKVRLDLAVKDGRLQVGPTTVKYLNGSTTIDAFVDANQSPPIMGLYMAVEDAQVEEILTSVDRPLVLGGQLTFFADLHSAGRSPHDIAANLQGETGFVIENGRIQRKIEMLASDALDFLFTGPASQSYTDLKCTAFRMLFEDGTGTIQVFFVETPGMRAEAVGHVNLADETIALVISPRSKRRLVRRSAPVRIHGPLQDPAMRKIPAEEAAILAGQVLVPIVALPARALGVLWSLINRDAEVSDCFIAPAADP